MSAILPFVSVNSRVLPAAEARISVLDHGLLYGDGLFETLRVYGGRFFRLQDHLDRLARGAAQLGIDLPWATDELAEAMAAVVAANGNPDASVRLTVTRGEGPPIPDPGVCPRPTYFITLRPAPPDREAGVSACVAGRHPRLFVPGVKSLCYLPFQQARVAVRAAGYDEAILEYAGNAVEGATSNLFLILGGKLLTPDLESGCLPGVTRAVVIALAREHGIAVEERPVRLALLDVADEAFLTNSLSGVTPVTRLGARTLGGGGLGPLTTRLHALYRETLAAETGVR